jgi:hypothetical protein
MVRQLFEVGIYNRDLASVSCQTAHSPVGLYPEQFGVKKTQKA